MRLIIIKKEQKMKNLFLKLNGLFCLICLCACAGSVDLHTTKLDAADYFQKAYEATDNNDFALAIRYYEAFQRNYPDDIERNLWADFEIAFTYYKMGNTNKALELFDILINKYAQDETVDKSKWPAAPRILAERIIAKSASKSTLKP